MNVIVIGGGAAGMMAAIVSAKEGNKVTLLEKTSSLGNKIKITGKGRCNITFEGDREKFKENVVKNYKFMYSSFSNFDNKDVVEYFNSLNVDTKVERGGRIFPVSDNAEEIVQALIRDLKKNKVEVKVNSGVSEILVKDSHITGVKLLNGESLNCEKCIIATGGKSYQKTGSSGDGYILAKKVGHNIIDIKPGLVPIRSNDNICKNLQGLSLRNISLKILDENKTIYEAFGELLFAHFGITGPIVLSGSSVLNRIENLEEKLNSRKIMVIIDLKPALDFDTLDKRICRDFEKYANKEFKNSLDDLLPKKLIPEIIRLSGIDENKKVHQINKQERQNLVKCIKQINPAVM
jgi:predicted Rossmann fold flavoprotein